MKTHRQKEKIENTTFLAACVISPKRSR